VKNLWKTGALVIGAVLFGLQSKESVQAT